LYNEDVSDEFKQDFEIRKPDIFLPPEKRFDYYLVSVIIGMSVLIGILILIIRKLRSGRINKKARRKKTGSKEKPKKHYLIKKKRKKHRRR